MQFRCLLILEITFFNFQADIETNYLNCFNLLIANMNRDLRPILNRLGSLNRMQRVYDSNISAFEFQPETFRSIDLILFSNATNVSSSEKIPIETQ